MQLMRKVVSLRGAIVSNVFCPCLCSAVIALVEAGCATGQVPQSARLTVAVRSFEVSGYARNAVALRESAHTFTEELRQTLAEDSLIRWLPELPRERPRDPVTGQIPAVHNMVIGSVEEGAPGSVLVKWQVLVAEDAQVLTTDTLVLEWGAERDGATDIAARVARVIRAAWRGEPPDPRRPTGT